MIIVVKFFLLRLCFEAFHEIAPTYRLQRQRTRTAAFALILISITFS